MLLSVFKPKPTHEYFQAPEGSDQLLLRLLQHLGAAQRGTETSESAGTHALFLTPLRLVSSRITCVEPILFDLHLQPLNPTAKPKLLQKSCVCKFYRHAENLQ